MSQYKIIEDNGDLTTDAVADAPREHIKEPIVIEEEPEKSAQSEERKENNKSPISFPTNTKKKSLSGNVPNAKPRKKTTNGAKTTHASTKVINVLNSSGVHIGAVNNYNLFSNTAKGQKNTTSTNTNQQKENIARTPAVDRVLGTEEFVTSKHIDFVSTHLGEGWRDVGDNLGYSKGQMDHFYADHKNAGHKEVIYKMLLDWTQAKPDECKIGTLASALWDADQKDIVCRWTKHF